MAGIDMPRIIPPAMPELRFDLEFTPPYRLGWCAEAEGAPPELETLPTPFAGHGSAAALRASNESKRAMAANAMPCASWILLTLRSRGCIVESLRT